MSKKMKMAYYFIRVKVQTIKTIQKFKGKERFIHGDQNELVTGFKRPFSGEKIRHRKLQNLNKKYER